MIVRAQRPFYAIPTQGVMLWKVTYLKSLWQFRDWISNLEIADSSKLLGLALCYLLTKSLQSTPDTRFKQLLKAFRLEEGRQRSGIATTSIIDVSSGSFNLQLAGLEPLIGNVQKRLRFWSTRSMKRLRQDAVPNESPNQITTDALFQTFLDDLWATLPSQAIYLRKSLPNPTTPFLRAVVEEYVWPYTVSIARNVSWDSRFHWFFPENPAGDHSYFARNKGGSSFNTSICIGYGKL
jgi:hypothetical protein